MMKEKSLILLLLPGLALLAGCDDQKAAATGVAKPAAVSQALPIDRWYTRAQSASGNALFQEYCASCHKPDASGTANWRETGADGKYPPPPLNGTAHTWHHPLSILRRTVRVGGVPLGGSMPGFGDKLNSRQIDDILAWVQSHWSDEIYRVWHERNEQSGKPIQSINKG
ncbi:MAG: cytochrome c [Gammaproteobacteria bacterium]|nr:cytochrome c [Gammaproteobacteria bacterium]